MSKNIFTLFLFALLGFVSCSDRDSNSVPSSAQVFTTFKFTHNWDGTPVNTSNFNTLQYTAIPVRRGNSDTDMQVRRPGINQKVQQIRHPVHWFFFRHKSI